jgi:septal ring-binding cell division protein DamX
MLAPGPAVSGSEAPPVADDNSAAMPEPPPTPSDYVSAEAMGDFLRLDPARFTVQLARANSADGFDTLLARLDVSTTATYRVAMGNAGSTTWVLLWGDYADIDSARQAARALPVELVRGAWPRKIGPLQDEARRSGSAPSANAPTASAVATSAPAPTPASPVPAPLPRDAALSGALEDAGADAFLRLPAQHFTVQLVSAGDALAAQAIAASAELGAGTVYVLRLNPAGAPTWIVVVGAHADLASARAQQAQLVRSLPAASVRRIGPLQTEVRAAARP